MTDGSSDRITQIEQLLQQSIIASNERMTRIEQSVGQLTESNARAIQALTEDLVTFKLTTEQYIEQSRLAMEQSQGERHELRQATIGVSNLLASLDSDRPTILKKLTAIENKVDQILNSGQTQG